MKRVGNISSASGLIFIGIWMIINENNKTFANEMIKWWPAIFIIMGIEILVYFNYKEENKKVGFNPLVIFVIILFIMSNIFIDVKDNLFNFNWSISDNWLGFLDSSNNNIDINKTINFQGNKVIIKANNATLRIKKSTDDDIKIEGTLSVSKDEKNYELKEVIKDKEITFDLKGNSVNGADLILYLPENLIIQIDCNNIKFDSDDSEFNASYKLNVNNGNIKINGNAENADITLNNGLVSIENLLSKNLDVKMNNGIVDIKTKDKNVKINADVDSGVTTINDSEIINSGMVKSYGNCEGKISVKVNHGTVNIKSQE